MEIRETCHLEPRIHRRSDDDSPEISRTSTREIGILSSGGAWAEDFEIIMARDQLGTLA
jgi:hypothetical protein